MSASWFDDSLKVGVCLDEDAYAVVPVEKNSVEGANFQEDMAR